MDVFILVGGFTVLCLMGMPVAYALGLAAIFAALWIDLPLEAIMLQTSAGMTSFSLLAIPFFILAGAIMAGVFPGLLLGLSLMILCLIIARRQNFPKGEAISFRQALCIGYEAIWGMVTVVIIIGGILSGIFTPTESAAVACVYAFLVTMFIYRDYKWRDLPLLVARVVRTVGMVMIMIGFSVAFGYMMALMRV